MFKTVTEYRREFDRADGCGGFGFDCDQYGNVEPRNPVAAESLRQCLAGEVGGVKMIDRGIVCRTYEVRVCNCGSGERPYWMHDARGIPVASVCNECYESIQARYRPEIFEDSGYECDERIEPLD